jgi:hypothetical protein
MSDIDKPTKAMLKAARKAVRREMEARSYDEHAYDEEVFKEGVADIARAAVEAALKARSSGPGGP